MPAAQLFGIGTQANRPWWVDIKVSGPTVTPGGPTVTPGGPTVTPGAGIAFDFATNACEATWYSRMRVNSHARERMVMPKALCSK